MGHLQANGFDVTVVDVDDLTPVKIEHGVAPQLTACHTAVVEGYVVEGHVPADVISRMLNQRPAIVGIAVPGMPRGSPGMESPYPEPYSVIAFDSTGGMSVYEQR